MSCPEITFNMAQAHISGVECGRQHGTREAAVIDYGLPASNISAAELLPCVTEGLRESSNRSCLFLELGAHRALNMES